MKLSEIKVGASYRSKPLGSEGGFVRVRRVVSIRPGPGGHWKDVHWDLEDGGGFEEGWCTLETFARWALAEVERRVEMSPEDGASSATDGEQSPSEAGQRLAESRRRIREAYPNDPTFTTLSGDEVVYRTVPPNIRVERVRVGRGAAKERGA